MKENYIRSFTESEMRSLFVLTLTIMVELSSTEDVKGDHVNSCPRYHASGSKRIVNGKDAR